MVPAEAEALAIVLLIEAVIAVVMCGLVVFELIWDWRERRAADRVWAARKR